MIRTLGRMPLTAAATPAARERHEHGADIRHRFDDVETNRPLSGDDVRIIERWHHR